MQCTNCVIIGAGAAGLYCAIAAASRGRRVLVLDHANKPGKKILMSGGGRCNFTNLGVSPDRYLGHNPHFPKSALSQYTQWDFIEWVRSHGIPYHEKTQGQLFCSNKARDLLEGLLLDCQKTGVEIRLNTTIHGVAHEPDRGVFVLETTGGKIYAESLVVATGGLSIPTMGSSPFAYQLAKQFSIPVRPVRAGLVPLTWSPVDLSRFQVLAGVSMTAKLETEEMSFLDDILFTHRGLSGPAALQISSYWKAGKLVINWLPGCYLPDVLSKSKREDGRFTLKKWLSLRLPNRLIPILINEEFANCRLADLTKDEIMKLESLLHAHVVKPSGTEGYRTAEVTLGGVDTDYLSSQTLQVKTLPSLYFIGEAVDVTGWLGGYNFQWAWSSGWVAGQYC